MGVQNVNLIPVGRRRSDQAAGKRRAPLCEPRRHVPATDNVNDASTSVTGVPLHVPPGLDSGFRSLICEPSTERINCFQT